MERLTKKSESGMVWFVDHENNEMELEPCEMDSHHSRLAIQKLAAYEDLGEQGLLLKLLCKVGDTVYYKTNNDDIYPIKINEINISNSDITYNGYFMKCTYEFDITDFGKTVFLTKEQAEEALIK